MRTLEPTRTRREGESDLVRNDEVEVIDYDPNWRQLFLAERRVLLDLLRPLSPEIHHIGSTAVPGLAAKPVVDIMVAVADNSEADRFIRKLSPLGYVHIEQDDPGRLFFRKGTPRTHHLHIVNIGSWTYFHHLWFRDYLIDHPAAAEEYECLKRVLAKQFSSDRAAYLSGKEAMIIMILCRAAKERLMIIQDAPG